jgi:hypothetical protein
MWRFMGGKLKEQELDEAKRIMERLVNTPHKPHKPINAGKIQMGRPKENVRGKAKKVAKASGP